MKTDQEVEQTIRDYLPEIIHMSLATSSGDRPWVCEVHFVYDDDLNLYFRSTPARRHSQEIAKNPNVAGNIVQQHALADKPRGVYFEGTAQILENFDKNHPAYDEFIHRLGASPEITEESKFEDGHKVYKITISNLYLFDGRSGPSQKYELNWNR